MSLTDVLVGQGGAVYRAPVGTQLPTAAFGTLDPAFESLGILTEDGVHHVDTPAFVARQIWPSRRNNHQLPSAQLSSQFSFTPMERNEVVLSLWGIRFGQAFAPRTNFSIVTGEPVWSFIIDIDDGLKRVRKVIPSARVINGFDASYQSSSLAAAASEITIEANGDYYEFDDAIPAPVEVSNVIFVSTGQPDSLTPHFDGTLCIDLDTNILWLADGIGGSRPSGQYAIGGVDPPTQADGNPGDVWVDGTGTVWIKE